MIDHVLVRCVDEVHGGTVAELMRPISEIGGGTNDYNELDNKPTLGTAAAKNVGTGANDVAAGDHTHAGGGSGPEVKSGVVSLTAGGSVNVAFPTPFASVPVVVPGAQFNNADTSCTYSCHSITVNGFTLRGAGNPAGFVGWIATAAGNS